MKKLATYTLLFAAVFGFVVGMTTTDVTAGGGGPPTHWCNTLIYDPFEVCTDTQGPLCEFPPIYGECYLYECEGRWTDTGEPCECTWVGCCECL